MKGKGRAFKAKAELGRVGLERCLRTVKVECDLDAMTATYTVPSGRRYTLSQDDLDKHLFSNVQRIARAESDEHSRRTAYRTVLRSLLST